MISKSELLESILHECRVVRQLASRMPDDGWDYRPSEAQRSAIELAQYICRVGQGTIRAGLDESFEWFPANRERFDALTPAEIPAAMDEQIASIQKMFDEEISDDGFATRSADMQDMGEWTLRGWLLGTTLKFLTAYRMQLFLYAKAAGQSDLDTWDCWNNDGTKERPQPAGA